MKIHKLNLENNYRNIVDSAIAVKAGLTPAVFAARPTYNDVLLSFNDGETPVLLLPKWTAFTVDLSQNKPSWAPSTLTGTLTVTIVPSVVGVQAEQDDVTLGNVEVYGVTTASTVGFPRESSISRAVILLIVVFMFVCSFYLCLRTV